MSQKDYWTMRDEELAPLARKYNIPTMEFQGEIGLESQVFNRDYIIAQLVSRDSARLASRSFVLSILSLVVSVAAVAISVVAIKSH